MERFIHGEAYKVRPDVRAVVHSHSPTVIPFSASQVPMCASPQGSSQQVCRCSRSASMAA
jgi:HCOMODA/2-hydroxy-3-carboxy-muconic semialdehyde decarboxylase